MLRRRPRRKAERMEIKARCMALLAMLLSWFAHILPRGTLKNQCSHARKRKRCSVAMLIALIGVATWTLLFFLLPQQIAQATPLMFEILMVGGVCLWVNHRLRTIRLRNLWKQCFEEACRRTAESKAAWPGCENAVMAVTTEPGIRTDRVRSTQITEEQWVRGLDLIEPAATPMMSFAENEIDLGATEFKKNVDGFPTPKGAAGRSDNEAAPASGSARSEDVTSGVRLLVNIAEAFSRTWRAGWIAQRVPSIVGMKDLNAAAKERYYKAMKIDQECAICSFDQTALVDAGSGVGAIGAGYHLLVASSNAYTSVSSFAAGKAPLTYAAPSGAVITGAISAGHSRAMWFNVAYALRAAAQRNTDWTCIAGLSLNNAISDLTNPVAVVTSITGVTGSVARSSDQVRVYLREENDNVLGVTVDTIKTPNGRIFIVPSDWLGTTTTTSTGGALTGAQDWATTSAGRLSASFINLPSAGLILKKGNLFKMWGVTPFTTPVAPDGGGDCFDVKSLMAWGLRNPKLAGSLYFSS